MYNRSASSRASIWSFLFPCLLFFRGSHTTSFVTCGFNRSYNQVAQVPSSKVTCNSPRSPWIKSRMAFALVSITHSITSFPAAFLTAIEILSLCTSKPIYLVPVIKGCSFLVSDLLGASARRMLEAIAGGETNRETLAALADRGLRATREQLQDALGVCQELNPVYRRLIKMVLDEVASIDKRIEQLNQEMASLLRPHEDQVKRLAEVPGLGVDSAQQIIAEVGATAATF